VTIKKTREAIGKGFPVTHRPSISERMIAKMGKRPLSLSDQYLKHIKAVANLHGGGHEGTP
jgi:hypothetical protein